MSWWARLRHAERLDRELRAELQDHLERQTAAYIAAGLPEQDARRRARLDFGSPAWVTEACRDARGTRAVEDILQDVRVACRLLARARWFTVTSIGALALGMSVMTMVVTIINGYYGQGLPVKDFDRVVYVGLPDDRNRLGAVSIADYELWRTEAQSFAAMAAFANATLTIRKEGYAPESVGGAYISVHTFDILQERPILGRGLLADDDWAGAPSVIVLSHRLWTSRYAADPGVIGKTIDVNGRPATVVGVMRDGFEFPYRHAAWQPLSLMPAPEGDARVLGVLGRLAGDIGRTQAAAELAALSAALPGRTADDAARWQPVAVRFGEQQVGRFGDTTAPLALLATAAFVLLIACGNVAGLLLTRAAARAREMAIRTAVGATRWRIIRQLIVESLMLALAAGGLGLWLSTFGVRFVAEAFGRNTPYWMRFTLDERVLLAVLTLCGFSVLLFGLAPAVLASRTNLNGVMKQTGRTSVTRGTGRWTGAVLAGQMCLTLVLLAAAGLMVRSYLALYGADRHIQTTQVLTAELTLPETAYPLAEARSDFYRRLDDRLSSFPGAPTAAITSTRPFVSAPGRRLALDSRPLHDLNDLPAVSMVAIGPRYFDTLGLALLQGRAFSDGDGRPGHDVAIVNARCAELYDPAGPVLGQRIRLVQASGEPVATEWLTIVGVSPLIRQGHASAAEPVVYVPLDRYPSPRAAIMIGGVTEPARTTSLLRHEVASLDPDVVVHNIRPLDELVADSRLEPKLMGTLLVAFAGIALFLSVIGLYAVTAYAVIQRRHEIGVRMALGARPAQVGWLFVRRRLTGLSAALAAGLAGAIAVGHVLESLLIDTPATDPPTLLAATALLIATSLAACAVPARRAARVDPLNSLRHE